MSFDAVGVVVMISGPGDTADEVAVVRDVIAKWNSDHAADLGVVFIPKHFSTDTVPVYRQDTDGQAVINEQITEHSDVVLCLFKYRLGTETPRNKHSGTVEEASLRQAEARVHMYFWDGAALPRTITEDEKNAAQWSRLKEFRESFYENDKGLYDTYDTDAGLREKVDRALWSDAREFQKTKLVTHSPIVAAPRDEITLNVSVDGTVWQAPEVARFAENLINSDIVKEREFAAAYNDRPDASLAAVLGSTRGLVRREPKSVAEIESWANGVRDRIGQFDLAIASAAATPIHVNVESDKLLERVEIEFVFTDVTGTDKTQKRLTDIWTPLHVPPRSIDSPIPRIEAADIDYRAIGPRTSSWEQDGDDVVLELGLDELRNRRRPITFDDAVILMLPYRTDTPSEIRYTWRASAVNTEQEWTGEGTLPVLTDSQSGVRAWLSPSRHE